MGFFCPITIIISFSRKTVKGFPKFLLFFLNYAVSRTFFRSLYQKELTIRKKHGIIKYSPTRTPPIRAVLSRCYTRNFFTSHPDDFIRRLSSHQIQTNVVGAPPIRVVLSRCYTRNFFTSYPDGIIWLSSNHQISTTIVEKSGWRSLISFGSTFPSVMKTFPCRCSHSLKAVRKLSLANPPRNYFVRTFCRG